MCDPVSATLAVVTATQMYQGSEARKAQSQAQDAATVQAAKQADMADQANNKANAKTPDMNGLMTANQNAGRGGIGGTMLTGPQGIDPSKLMLGKTTLLGG